MADETQSVATDHAVRAIRLRGARDRLVDLLGLGETYPLQDLPVLAEELIVPLDTTAKIPVDPGQSDVLYELRDRGQEVSSAGAWGTGGKTILETPPMEEDVTFEILAQKIDTKREASEEVDRSVSAIIEDVRERGDAAGRHARLAKAFHRRRPPRSP